MIKTPQNQQRLTNVSIVKLKKGGKKFEVCDGVLLSFFLSEHFFIAYRLRHIQTKSWRGERECE